MIDYLHIEKIIEDVPKEVRMGSEIPFKWCGLKFSPRYNSEGLIRYYAAEWWNLFLIISGDKLILRNSIQKFYCGNNYKDFTLKDFRKAISILSKRLNIDIGEANVKKFEYGCNVPHPNPEIIYSSLIGYQRGKFNPMMNGARVYGSKQVSSDYTVKAYDKQYEVSKHHKLIIKPVVRYEKMVKNIRYLNRKGIKISKVKHLLKRNIWRALSEDLLETYMGIQKKPIVNYNELPIQIVKEIAVLEHNEISSSLRKNRNGTYLKYVEDCSGILGFTKSLKFQTRMKRKCKQMRMN